MTLNPIRHSCRLFALLALAVFVCAVNLSAQTYTDGSIAGTVFDSSGAVVPNASVTVHNDGTNAENVFVTDSSGYFKDPIVPPAVYTVTVTAQGFAPFKEVNVIVQVGVTTEIQPHLALSSTQTSVEVTGEAPVLNFESPDISTVLNPHAVADLPLNGGRWSNLTLLTPGATLDTAGYGLISFRAMSTILNNVEVDGADDNQAYYAEERGRTREGYSTSKYLIQEFQVNTGVYSAEFGRSAGGVVNSITKSGTNDPHGILYFADRDNGSWGAYNEFTTNTTAVYAGGGSLPTSFVTAPYKPKDWRKQWGFDVGGPIKKDKLFWFYGYNEFHRNFPGTGKAATPSNFFTIPDSAAPAGSTCNLTGATAGTMTGLTSSSSTYQVDQESCELAARLGYTSYAAGASAYSTQLAALLPDLGPVPRFGNLLLNTPKLDWQINEKNHLSVLYHRLSWDSPGGVQTQATNTYAIDSFGNDYVKLDYGLTKLDSLITSDLSNEIRYQYGRELNDEGQQPFSSYTNAHLTGLNGITNTAAGDFTPNRVAVSLDSPSTNGFYLGSEYYDYRKALPDEHKWQVGDTAAWEHGNQNIKFGIDMLHNYDLINNTYEGNGVYTYSYIGNFFADVLNEGAANGVCNSTHTVTSPGSSANYTGTAPCGTFVQGFGEPAWDIAVMNYGFFAEDHWKLTPRISMDLGLRYDYEALPSPYSYLVQVVGPPTGSFTPYLASTNGLCAGYTGPGSCPALAADANLTNHPSEKTNFGPRVGIVLDPFGRGKTTVRLGYGLYFGPITNGVILNNLLNTGSPLGQYTTSTYYPNTAGAPQFPNIIGAGAGGTPTSYFFAKDFKNPEVNEFDFSIQQEVTRGTIFQVSYMGALARELPNGININFNPNANTATSGSPNGVVQSVITVSDASGKGPIPNGTQFVVPTYTGYMNTHFGAVNELVSNINSSYNALVAEIQNKTWKLVQFDLNYTWSHALDYNQNANTTTMGNGVIDPYNIDHFRRGGNYGNSIYDIPNRVVAWALINSPDFHTTGWLKWITNEWSLNPEIQSQNGLPYSAGINTGSVSTSAYNSGAWNGALSGWLPPIGRNTYQYAPVLVIDSRLEKQFTMDVHDKPYHLQLIGEFFNLGNHQNVTTVNTGAYNLSANGSVTSGCSGSSLGAGQAQEECSTMTFIPKAGAYTSATGFGAATSTNNVYMYTPREIELTLRMQF